MRPAHIVITGLLFCLICIAAPSLGSAPLAQLIEKTQTHGGLIVYIGSKSGDEIASLYPNNRYLVQVLSTKAEAIDRCRAFLEKENLYGPVSVTRFDGEHLPYVDNMVNLLIAEDLFSLSEKEMLRVVCPGGSMCLLRNKTWTIKTKAHPASIDEWSHFLHDASNNAVASDREVGPPRRLQWQCGPYWTRSHEFLSSLCTMVSAGGRIFYIFDEGITGMTDAPLPERWMLIARDAFNGVLLWKRPLPCWGSQSWKRRALRSIPQTSQKSLVASQDRVYITRGEESVLSILDAATGTVISSCPGTKGTDELRLSEGVVVLQKNRKQLMALDGTTGNTLWEHATAVQPLTLTVHKGNVAVKSGKTIVCFGLHDGKKRWQVPQKEPVKLMLADGGKLFLLERKGLRALSLDKGAALWKIEQRVTRNELFAADGTLWYWNVMTIEGRDAATGKRTHRINPADVFTKGHHLRCYQSKATDRFLITPNRGVEFVSIQGEENTQNDWLRGPCGYGIMPCNGLLYAPPNPCFCYPGVKLPGFNVLAPAPAEPPVKTDSPRLATGPAFRSKKEKTHGTILKKRTQSHDDWPMYRHDQRRSGASLCTLSPRVDKKWEVDLSGKLTPPVVAGSVLYVSLKNKHRIEAINIDTGKKLWRFTAGGPVDSPPAVSDGFVVFGCADGNVYCLIAEDGALVWRFRAAPSERKIVSFGNLESPWRVHGSVLIVNDTVYFTAGRSTHLDGGIHIYGLSLEDGGVRHHYTLNTWARTRKDAENKPFIPGYHMEGARSDILVCQGGALFLGQYKFNLKLERLETPYVLPGENKKGQVLDVTDAPYSASDRQPDQDYETHQRQWLERTQKDLMESLRTKFGGISLGRQEMGMHLVPTGGFLDASWFNRTYWMYASFWPGYYLAHRGAKTGQLLVVGPKKTYALQAYPSRNLQSPLFTPGKKGYLLFADSNESDPALDRQTQETTKGTGYTRTRPPEWFSWVPVRIRSMVLTRHCLFAAGPPDVLDPEDVMGSFEGRKGAQLCSFSPETGKQLSKTKLDDLPVFDGLIAAGGRLFLCTQTGKVLCFENP